MSSYLYASSNAYSVNGENYAVRIIETVAGTDSTKTFDVGPQGVNLVYESTDDTMLVPGIVKSRCEVSTIWDSDDTTLTSLIADLLAANDGDFLLEILRDGTRIWVGSILIEQVDLLESTPTQTLRIVATDGLALLKNVDYNNNGTAYTGYQILFDNILSNIQEKWVLWPYLDDENIGGPRIELADDVYSPEDYILSGFTHPAGTNLAATRRMRIHTNAFRRVNQGGSVTYLSCYDLLESICLTLQLRLYYYANAWTFVPVNLSDQEVLGYTKNYDDSITYKQIVGTSNFQKNSVNDIIQKDASWVQSFTPAINTVSLTRDPNQGATVLSEYSFNNGDTLTAADVSYEGVDTVSDEERYVVRARFFVTNTAISIDNDRDAGRFILESTIRWAPTGTSEYYGNTLARLQTGASQVLQFLNFSQVEYVDIALYDPTYSSSAITHYHIPEPLENAYYTPSENGSRYIDIEFSIPPPQTAKTGLTITPDLRAYNVEGERDAILQAALSITGVEFIVTKFSGDELSLLQTFKYETRSSQGRGKIDLGTTYVGALGQSMGNINVETSAGVFEPTNNWVNQASNTSRAINKLCVEEVLAAHQNSRSLQRGSIVLRGTNATPGKPFARYSDRDTGDYFTALNWSLQSTQAEIALTLRKIGRDAISVTTEAIDGTRLPGDVQGDTSQGPVKEGKVMYGYNNEARANFQGDWSSIIGTLGGATKEMYLTTSNLGQGRFIDDQGNTPEAGKYIQRRIYINRKGLSQRTDSQWQSLSVQPQPNDKLSDVMDIINNAVSRLEDHGSYTFMVAYSEFDEDEPLLETYAGATGAYSLRKLRSTYTGNAIQVRRTTPTAASQDIGFNAQGELDTGALFAFCGSGDGYVQKWYNQATTGVDLQQISTASQPKIFSAGSTILLNGKPAIEFDGSNDSLVGVTNVNLNANVNELIVAWVGSVYSVSVGNTMASHWNATQANQVFQLQVNSNANMRAAHRYSDSFFGTADDPGSVANTQYVAVMHTKQNHHELYRNGSKTVGSKSNVAPNDENTSFRVGARSDNQATPHGGKTQEVVIWSRATAADDADDISASINNFYSAY